VEVVGINGEGVGDGKDSQLSCLGCGDLELQIACINGSVSAARKFSDEVESRSVTLGFCGKRFHSVDALWQI